MDKGGRFMEFQNKKTALILEGGALRSFFTCGVLDYFMEKDIYFPCVCGVSAGSLCAISYLSRQIGRTAEVNLKFVNDKRYMSLHSLIKDKMIFNFDFLFGEISHNLVPLDYDTFYNSTEEFFAFVTDCESGKSVACEKGKCSDILKACRASSSMPVLSKIVELDGHKYLDGGTANPIPFEWAIENGYEKIVLVLTRDIDYRKKPLSGMIKKVYGKKYAQYPELLKTIYNIPDHYNSLAEQIVRLENEDRLFVIRPDEPVRVKRMEKDTKKLEELYEVGRRVAENRFDKMIEYLF